MVVDKVLLTGAGHSASAGTQGGGGAAGLTVTNSPGLFPGCSVLPDWNCTARGILLIVALLGEQGNGTVPCGDRVFGFRRLFVNRMGDF